MEILCAWYSIPSNCQIILWKTASWFVGRTSVFKEVHVLHYGVISILVIIWYLNDFHHLKSLFLFPLNAQELPLEMVVPLSDMEVEDLTEVLIQCQCSQDDIRPIWKKVTKSERNWSFWWKLKFSNAHDINSDMKQKYRACNDTENWYQNLLKSSQEQDFTQSPSFIQKRFRMGKS